ncbi:MAG: hypothetical protein V1644_03560 [Candidatus Micrarchaeota archaeon]
MFRISVAEVVAFLVLAFAVYGGVPAVFEWPLLIVTLVVLAFVAYFSWFYLRLMFSKVVIVRGTGVAVLTKDFQTQPITENPEVWKIISNLRNMHVTAVVWSFTQDFEQSVYASFNLKRFFDKCFYPSDFKTSDSKEYLKGICNKLGISPSKVVLIDSDDKAIAAGKSLGMTVFKYIAMSFSFPTF